jgi:hypothetical protein
MSDRNWQTILQVGCEGGCISLLGRKEKYDWTFTMTTDETSLKCFIHEEDLAGELETKSHIEYSWEGALRLLEQYPHWPSLYPVAAHPNFIEQIINALRDKETENLKKESYFGQIDWTRWVNVFVKSTRKPNGTIIESKYQWNKLNKQQVGTYTEYFVKMELTMYGFGVYSTEIDDRGIDFIARRHGEPFIEIQVKSLRKYGYVFMQQTKFEIRKNVYLALGLMFEHEAPRLFLIPATAWLKPNEVFVERNYEGLKSAPEWGVNISRKNMAALEKYRFEAALEALAQEV